ncbi:MAG: hypothetical protein ACYC7A_11480 [Thermoanaerobaculia bacterium]
MQKARECLDDLLVDVPEDVKELKKRMRGVTVRALAEAMAERMREGYDSREFIPYYVVASMLASPEVEAMLARVTTDRDVPITARAAAFTMLDDAVPVLVRLEDEAPAVMRAGFRELVIAAVLHGTTGMIAELFGGPAGAEVVFAEFDEARRALGVPAAILYDEALRAPEAEALHSRIVDAIVDDRLHGTAEILEMLAAAGGPAESMLKRAAMKARSSPEAAAVRPHRAFVGPATPMSAFLGIRLRNADESEFAIVVRDPYGEAIEAIVDYSADPEVFDERFAQLFMVPGDLLPVAERLRPAAVPEELRAAALLVATAGAPPAPPALPAAEGVDKRKLKKLLASVEYEDWVLSPWILNDAAVPAPGGRRPGAQWIEDALRLLEDYDGAIPERVVSAARQMARWHAAQGESKEAALLAAAADEADFDFPTSTLGELMIRRSVEAQHAEALSPRRQQHAPEMFAEVRAMIRGKILEPGSDFHEVIEGMQDAGYSREDAIETVVDFVFEQTVSMGK